MVAKTKSYTTHSFFYMYLFLEMRGDLRRLASHVSVLKWACSAAGERSCSATLYRDPTSLKLFFFFSQKDQKLQCFLNTLLIYIIIA